MKLLPSELAAEIKLILETITADSECGIGCHAGDDWEHDERCWECQRYLKTKKVLDRLKELW